MNIADHQSAGAFTRIVRGGTQFRRIHLFLAAGLHWLVASLMLAAMDHMFGSMFSDKTPLYQWAAQGAIVPLYLMVDALCDMKLQRKDVDTLAPAPAAFRAAIFPALCGLIVPVVIDFYLLPASFVIGHPAIPSALSAVFGAAASLAPSTYLFLGLVYASTRIIRVKPTATA